MNPTAPGEFLQQFPEQTLRQYVERLRAAAEHKRRIGGWVRHRRKLRAAS